ncbi:POU domain, class 6, transcription factor 2-like [Megalops cyprinoides]|uniref:POU domain, class 6, transcription factor 2-like n=1 Tax=Megalops cyprinoides TaxID=118141 RepID=UPI00186568BB|nr:POU domain, class 6, transcription factor 2-like [Megalops cyprinoides]
MIAGRLGEPPRSLRGEMSDAERRAEERPDTPDSELSEPAAPPPPPPEASDGEDEPRKPYGTHGSSSQRDESSSPSEQSKLSQSYPTYPVGPQHLLAAQQLASAVAGVMPGGPPGLNQPVLIPFNMAGQLSGQQGLLLTMPTANLANIQGLVAAAAAGGIMTLPLQNLQATSSLNSRLQHLQKLQQLQHQQQHQQQQQQRQQQQQHLQQQQRQQQQQQQYVGQTLSQPSNQQPSQHQRASPSQQHSPSSFSPLPTSQGPQSSPPPTQSHSPPRNLPSPLTPPTPLQLNSRANQAAALGSMGGSQAFSNTLPGLQGVSGQLVTNAQGQIIGTIPLMSNSAGSPSQSGGATPGLPVQPITPQLLTNAQGQVIATVIGNQILPVINTQGITLSPVKPGQQLPQVPQGQVGPMSVQAGLLHQSHSQASLSQSPVRQTSSSSSSPPSSALSVGQLINNPQTTPSEVDGVNLEEIREFAKAFKIRRLSLGLTQTQVGQALSAAEGPAYSQSAICRHTILRSHFFLPQEAQESAVASGLSAKLNPGLLYPARFEKLDITPKSAQKIKPVLECWMAEAEARHRAGVQNLSEFIGSEPSKKRKRRTSFTPQALEILNTHFEKNTHPSGQEMTEIAERLNYDREVVRVWFCNKRQALKNTIKRLKPAELDPAPSMDALADDLLNPLEKHP